MALNGKYVSLEEVLEGTYIRAGLQSIDWSEAMFHVGRLLAKMGVPTVHVVKNTDGSENNIEPILVENFKAELPNDLVMIQAIRDYETKIPLLASNDMYFVNPQNPFNFVPADTVNFDSAAKVNDSDIIRRRLRPSYKINNGVIYTNYDNIQLEITYLAIPTDSRGYPLIPDDERIKEAIEWTILEALDYKGYRQGKVNRDIYNLSKQNKSWAVAAAITHAITPTIDEMQSIVNAWARMIPNVNAHNNNFATTHVAEKRFLH